MLLNIIRNVENKTCYLNMLKLKKLHRNSKYKKRVALKKKRYMFMTFLQLSQSRVLSLLFL